MLSPVQTVDRDDRRKLYGDAQLKDKLPGRVNRGKHTMGPDVLLKYIGLHDYRPAVDEAFQLKTKKFSAAQADLIKRAVDNEMPVRVIGAYRGDIDFVVEANGRVIEPGSLAENKRENTFNNLRPTLLVTQRKQDASIPQVWVVVFPSSQYVEQYAELVLAIMIELEIHKRSMQTRTGAHEPANRETVEEQVRKRISVTHFPKLAKGIGYWSNLHPFAARNVRLGDIVTIGNIDIFETGLKSFSFVPERDGWLWGGLDNMFGLKVLVNQLNKTRIGLLGVTECFWGDASAQYVEVMLHAGARHILYGSKAATLVDEALRGHVIAPTTFVTVHRGLGPKGELPDEDVLTDEISFPNVVKSMAAAFDINYAGLAITVPTVIGEDHDEYRTFNTLSPGCMDCENGHIASVINQFNKGDERVPIILHARRARDAEFVPLHYVTDYIYAPSETPGTDGDNLAADNRDEQHIKRKLRGYTKIGQYFGAYTNIFGLRHDFDVPKLVDTTPYVDSEYVDEIKSTRRLIEAGASRDAIAVLLSSGGRHTVTARHALAVAVVCQKYGFIDAAFKVLSLADPIQVQNVEDRRRKVRVAAVRLKLCMQLGDFGAASQELRGLLLDVDTLEYTQQLSAVHRRQMVLSGLQGDYEGIEIAHQAAFRAGAFDVETEKRKTALFSQIAFYAANNCPSDDIVQQCYGQLSEIRRNFLTGTNAPGVSAVKAAVAALLLEAGFALNAANRRRNYRGRLLLAITHHLGRRLGGNECAETFGEIIQLTRNPDLRDLMRFSLRQDDFGRREFAQWCEYADIDADLSEKCMQFLQTRREDDLLEILTANRNIS